MKTYRAFTIKYIGMTNTRASRISIFDNRFKQQKSIHYNYEFNNIADIAQNYLENIGIPIIGVSETPKGYILFTDNFKTSIKGGVI